MNDFETLGTCVVNRRTELFDVYIGRGGPFGNPFTHYPLATTKAQFKVSTRRESIDRFEEWIFDQPQILALVWSLRGKKLGCYCVPLPCHGTVYVILVAAYAWIKRQGGNPDWTTPEGRAQIKKVYMELKATHRS